MILIASFGRLNWSRPENFEVFSRPRHAKARGTFGVPTVAGAGRSLDKDRQGAEVDWPCSQEDDKMQRCSDAATAALWPHR